MSWAQATDIALFRFFNQRLANPVLDWLMPFCNGNKLFIPTVALLCIFLLWRGGVRGRAFVPILLLILAVGDTLIINTIKHAVARPRPYVQLDHVRLLVGEGYSGSMPSSHTSTWFAATLIAYVFYRPSWRMMLPLAIMIGFSRMYVGAHYPSDVLVGALAGAGYAAAGLAGLNLIWNSLGRRWFPEAWQRWPSLFGEPCAGQKDRLNLFPEQRWINLGYVLIAVTLLARLIYLASGKIELSEDEAYQWIWSKHLALSYFSKPPFIAYAQFLGTAIWGDNEFGVRFLSPCIAALAAFILLRFIARTVNPRAGFWLVVVLQCAPLLAVGATLMTIDPLLVLFWTCAMVAGWRAVQPESRIRDWIWVGIALGAGFLSKYSAAYEIVCLLLFVLAWPAARPHLRRPGPYVALLLVLIATLPVIIWNSQHGWITVKHVAENAGLDKAWQPTLRYLKDFVAAEVVLLNPVLLIASIWVWAAFWKRRPVNPLLLYLFCMGAPVVVGHLLFTLHYRVQPNWIAPAIIPMFCCMVIYWEQLWREGVVPVRSWLIAALAIGILPVIILHDTNLVIKLTGHPLPANKDPLRRVRAWRETAQAVGEAREALRAEGPEAFVIAGHYGLVGELTFYLPEAKARVKADPLVFYQSSERPENQFYFWPGYGSHKGQNAIYVQEHEPGLSIPESVEREFSSVQDLGLREIEYRGRVFRTLHLYACRNLTPERNARHEETVFSRTQEK